MEEDAKTYRGEMSMDPEFRMNQLIDKAFNKVEEQIADGTVSPSVLTFLMKMATAKDKLEIENLKSKSELNLTRIKESEEKQTQKALMEEAMAAMRDYRPSND